MIQIRLMLILFSYGCHHHFFPQIEKRKRIVYDIMQKHKKL